MQMSKNHRAIKCSSREFGFWSFPTEPNSKTVILLHLLFVTLARDFHYRMVGVTGFEPVTLRLSSACSNQLSYTPLCWLRAGE
jgi:hypothetical protein